MAQDSRICACIPGVVAPMEAVDDELGVSKPCRVAIHTVFFERAREVIDDHLGWVLQIRPQDWNGSFRPSEWSIT